MSIFRWAAPILKIAGRRWELADFEALAIRLRPYVPPGGLVADLGGGTGDLGIGIAQALDAQVIIIDPTPQMLSRVDSHPMVSTSLAAAEDLPFPDAHFHALICSDAFHHVRDQEAAAREITRVVRPGGGVMLLELEPSRILITFERMLGEPAAFMPMRDMEGFFAARGVMGESIPQRYGYLYVGSIGDDRHRGDDAPSRR